MINFVRVTGTGLLILCQSCATSALWDATHPDSRVWIESNKITPAQLEQRCAKQQVDALPVPGGYLVGKSKGHKKMDVAFRVVGTPVTLALDAASGVVLASAGLIFVMPQLFLPMLEDAAN
jgi:hypothetical protein